MTYQCSDEPAKADTSIKGTENDESGSPLVITGLKWGHYQLVETNPKDGYAIVDSDGNAKIGYSVNFEMEKYGMKESTPDPEKDEKIQQDLITDEKGQITVDHLPEGNYYFMETGAPDDIYMDGGISEVAEINSSVNGKTVTVNKTDEAFKTEVTLNKGDLDTGKALIGAQFTLYRKDSTGNFTELMSQMTDAEGKLSFILNEAGSYRVVKTDPPLGYENASYSAEFTVTNTAEFQDAVLQLADSIPEETATKYDLTVLGNLSDNNETITNKATETQSTITVTKYVELEDAGGDLELNAKDSVFYVALFKDPDGTKRCSDVKAIHIQNGISASAVFENVTKGIYYVFETDADGTAVPFEVLVNDEKGNMYYCIGENTEAITITPEEAKEENAELYNCYMDVPDNFYLTGKIQITKNVRKAGKTITTGETFYAGIFDEDDNLVRVEELKENDTITVDLPLGGESGTEPVTYTVKETTVTPTPTSEMTPTVTPVSQGTISGDNSGNHSAVNAKTGDETKTGVYVLLLMLSAAILDYGRRKHKKGL